MRSKISFNAPCGRSDCAHSPLPAEGTYEPCLSSTAPPPNFSPIWRSAASTSVPNLTRAYLDQIEQHDGRKLGPSCALTLSGRRLARAEEIDRPARSGGSAARPPWLGCPVAGQGCALHTGRDDNLRFANARAFPSALRRHGGCPTEGGRRRAHRQGEHGRVRRARAARTRTRPSFTTHNPWDLSSASPAAPAAARPLAWPREWRRSPSAPTRAVPSAARRASAESPGSSRLMAA